MVALQITPCEKVIFPDLFLCLANFQETPYKDSTFTHKATHAFFRFDPDFRSIHEHYLLCLGNLFC
jgi:hypothetical protein